MTMPSSDSSTRKCTVSASRHRIAVSWIGLWYLLGIFRIIPFLSAVARRAAGPYPFARQAVGIGLNIVAGVLLFRRRRSASRVLVARLSVSLVFALLNLVLDQLDSSSLSKSVGRLPSCTS